MPAAVIHRVIVLIVPPILEWAFIDSVWNASSLTECREKGTGACWAVINERFVILPFASTEAGVRNVPPLYVRAARSMPRQAACRVAGPEGADFHTGQIVRPAGLDRECVGRLPRAPENCRKAP